MKIKNTFLLGIITIAGFCSCVSEDFENGKGGQNGEGIMTLDVAVKEPSANVTRAVTEVTNFPVTVFDADGNTVKSYSTVADVPSSVIMAVGNYTVESHTPGELVRQMDAPYYKGTEPMEIMKGITTPVNVVCTMQNSSIKVLYQNGFDDVFSAWTITLDDGGSTALTFTEEQGLTPAIVYWLFQSEATQLKFNFRGTNKNGSTVTANNTLTKSQAEERYDDDKLYFSGGDAIVITVNIVESTEGEVTGVNISATVTFTEHEDVVTIETTDDDTLTPDDNQGGGEGGDDNFVQLTLFDPITFTMGEGSTLDPSIADVSIACEKGIKSVMVKAESTNPDMVESLIAVGGIYGLDFVDAGVEVVDNSDLVQFFLGLGKNLSVPAEGDLNYNFPVGNFFSLLDVMSGTHTFNLTVTDLEGHKKSGSVVITVNE